MRKLYKTSQFLCLCLCTFFVSAQSPDWWLENAPAAVDISLSHNGNKCLVGEDGKVYQWIEATADWQQHGNRSNFVRLDVNSGYIAAITENGNVFISSTSNAYWIDLGVKAEDVSIGNGVIWLANASYENKQNVTLKGSFSLPANLDDADALDLSQIIWLPVDGKLSRLDIDGQNKLWAIDTYKKVFSLGDLGWIPVSSAPLSLDIGAGKNGTVFVVAEPVDETLGGGKVFQRNLRSGVWNELIGRASEVSAGIDDVVWGINSLDWLITSTIAPVSSSNSEVNENQMTIQALMGPDYDLPEGLSAAIVTDLTIDGDVSLGLTVLNGLETKVAIYTPNGGLQPNLLLGHGQLSFVDYMPDIADSGFSDIGSFNDAVVMLVHEDNLELAPTLADGQILSRYLQNPKIGLHQPLDPIEFVAEYDLTTFEQGQELTQTFQLINSVLYIEGGLPNTIFTNVSNRLTPAEPLIADSERTFDDLIALYGQSFMSGFRLYASAEHLENKKLGPAILSYAEWQLSIGQENSIGLVADLTIPIQDSTDSLQISEAIMRFNHTDKAFILSGSVQADQVAKAASNSSISIGRLNFDGKYYLDADPLSTSQLNLQGVGKFVSAQQQEREIKLRVELALAEDKSSVIPSLFLETGLTLADVFGEQIPVAGNVELTDVILSPDLLMGAVNVNGKKVQVARLSDDSLASPLVVLMHEELAIKTYVPELADSPLAGLLFDNSLIFGRQGGNEGEVFETLEDVPDILKPYLIDDFGLFPLTIKDGLSAVAFRKQPQSAEQQSEEEKEEEKITNETLQALGIPEQGYMARAYFDADMLLHAIYNEADDSRTPAKDATNKPAAASEQANQIESALAALPAFDFSVEFQVADVEVPYLEKMLSLSGAKFQVIREGDSLQAGIVSGMTVQMPTEDETKPLAVSMAGAIRFNMQGDSLDIEFAGSTTIDKEQASVLSLAAIAELPIAKADPEFDPELQAAWKKVFGVPTFSLLHAAFTSSINVKDLPETLETQMYGSGYLGREAITANGKVKLELSADKSTYDFAEASFTLPGPIRLARLPGYEKVPKVNEMSLRNLHISMNEMYGRLDWPKEQSGGDMYMIASENDQQQAVFELFTRFDQFNLSMLEVKDERIDGLRKVAGFPDAIWKQEIGPVVLAMRSKSRENFTLAEDTPEALAALFKGKTDSEIPNQRIALLNEGDSVILAEGMTSLSIFDPSKVKSEELSSLLNIVGLSSPVSMTGAIERQDDGKFQGRFKAITDSLNPNSTMDVFGLLPVFGETSLLISTLDGGEFGLETTASITLGSEIISMFGYRKFKQNTEGKILNDDWQFRAPGPILLGGLPGLEDVPQLNQWLLSDIVFQPNSMTGRVDWAEQSTGGVVQLNRDDNGEMSFMARMDSFEPSMLLTELEGSKFNQTLSPAFIAWRPSLEKESFIVDENMPESLSEMLLGKPDSIRPYQQKPLLKTNTTMTLAKGLTLVGMSNIDVLESVPSLELFFQVVSLTDDSLLMSGIFEKDEQDRLKSEVQFVLGGLEIPNIPSTSIQFSDATLNLSNIEENKVTISTLAMVSPPLPVELRLPMKGNLVFEQNLSVNTLSYELMVVDEAKSDYKISSEGIWKNPPLLPDVEVTDLGFAGSIVYELGEELHQCALVGNSKVDTVEAEVNVELCGGRNISTALEDPNYDPILYIEQEIRLSTIMEKATGFIQNTTDVGAQQDRKLAIENMMAILDAAGDVAMSKILISNGALAGDLALNVANRASIKGSSVIAFDDNHLALFVRSDETIQVGALLPDNMAPLDQISIPKGVFAISTQSDDEFSLAELPIQIFDNIFGDLLDKEKGQKLRVTNGVTFLTKSNTGELPPGIKEAAETFGLSGEFILGGSLGGVFAGPPSVGIYVGLGNVTAPLPNFAGEVIEIKNANAELAMTMQGPGMPTEVALRTEATLKVPRLDDPGTRESIDSTVSIAYEIGGPSAGSLSVSAKVDGQWDDPMGFDDFSLTDAMFSLGVSGAGTTISINAEEAVFKEKRFIMDLDTAWAGGMPTQLAVQFAKSPNMSEDLILDPMIQVELVNSIFQLAMNGGSTLAGNVFKALESEMLTISGPPGSSAQTVVNSLDAFATFSRKLQRTAGGLTSLMKYSPLGMVGIKNPEIFFVTPGNNLPPREGIDRPPLGLGLIAQGSLVLHAGNLNVDIADGEYKINLRDGYYVSGQITPPAPLNESSLSVSGSQSLITFSPTAMRLQGKLKLPNLLIPGFPAVADGYFDFYRSDFSADTEISAGFILAEGVVNREASFTVKNNNVQIYSVPKGCVDVPIKLDGNISVSGPADAIKFLNIAQPALPDVSDLETCPEALLQVWRDVMANPARAPQVAADAILDASKLALSALPDNEATRALYQGVESVEQALGFTSDVTDNITDPLGDLPGAGELGDGFNGATGLVKDIPGFDIANQAAAAAVQEAAAAAAALMGGATALLGGDPAAFVANIGGAALDAVSDIGNLASAGISTISNAFGGGRNYCNVLIENMRDDNIAPESVERAMALWLPFKEVWVASKEAQAIGNLADNVYTRSRADLEAFYYLSSPWNQIAANIEAKLENNNINVNLQNEYAVSYHTSNVPNIPFETNTAFVNNSMLKRDLYWRAAVIDRVTRSRGMTIEQTMGRLKSWQEISNFDPGADYPGFRCEKQSAVVDSMHGAIALRIQVTPSNVIATDYLLETQLTGALNSVYNIAAEMRTLNSAAISQLITIQTAAITRNVTYIADMKAKMDTSMRMLEAMTEDDDYLSAFLIPHILEADVSIQAFFDDAIKIASEGVAANPAIDVTESINKAAQKIANAYRQVVIADVNRLNQPWSSKNEMTTLIFPYADQCLRSFYRSDNKNPLFVTDCHPKLQEILEQIQNGVSKDITAGTRLLQIVRTNASTGEKNIIEDLRYQFWIWDLDAQPGVTRLATAQSMQSPLSSYCLGVPRAFATPVDDPIVEATPCIEGDTSQHWEKLPDEGGPSYFRLMSVESGLCATWNGLSGVYALVLKTCNEANKAKQVMTAGWPIRQAEHEPVQLQASERQTYAWKNFDNGRCLRHFEPDTNGFTAGGIDCGNIKADMSAAPSLGFIPERTSQGTWQFSFIKNGSKQCLASSDQLAAQFNNASAVQGDRTVAAGSCTQEDSYWIIDKSDISGEGDQRKYRIREASGKGQCMMINQSIYGQTRTLRHIPIKLVTCKQERDDRMLFYPVEIAPTGQEYASHNSTISGVVELVIGSQLRPAAHLPMFLELNGVMHTVFESNEFGEFTFSGLEPGNYTLKPHYRWDLKVYDTPSFSVQVPANANVVGKYHRVKSIFKVGGNIRLKTSSGISAFTGHNVSLYVDGELAMTTLSDDAGRYQFTDLASGDYEVVVDTQGHEVLTVPTNGMIKVTVNDKNAWQNNFTLQALP